MKEAEPNRPFKGPCGSASFVVYLEVRTKVRHSEEKVGRVMYLVNELKFVLGRKGISGRFLLYLV